MRVVHLSTMDSGGGAARGTFTLHKALVDMGVDSWMVVEQPTVDGPNVRGVDKPLGRYRHAVRHRVDRLPLKAYPSRSRSIFSPTLVASGVVDEVDRLDPDIVHLHWVATSFVRPEDLPRFGKPFVWSLRDMWPFTGGCHYAGGCNRYMESCGSCPHLASTSDRDLSRWVWSRKQRAWADVELTPVGISTWIAERAAESSLFGDRDIRVIENAIDTVFWAPAESDDLSARYGLPADKILLLFVSMYLDDDNKGFSFFSDMCRRLNATHDGRFHAIVVGDPGGVGGFDLGMESTFTGRIDDDEVLRALYSAADIAVLPSVIEAFGKTGAEALSCGTPCIVFEGTGLEGVVTHRETGYVAPLGSAEGLVAGVEWVLADPARAQRLSASARDEAVRRFSVTTQVGKYRDLYDEIMRSQSGVRSV